MKINPDPTMVTPKEEEAWKVRVEHSRNHNRITPSSHESEEDKNIEQFSLCVNNHEYGMKRNIPFLRKDRSERVSSLAN
ncbi:hypothetical protein OSB04_012556 [Centaurea solstitialis]|uniref:Uncharacterized protein n=1 Tax=Centaurea solstitialis TaxID=347529 RepID=A0AA38WEP9_9ASTR|nr:hypothetical protein OSB04_012556 [Centaurea solstitialis]